MTAIKSNPADAAGGRPNLRLNSAGVFLRAGPAVLRDWVSRRPLPLVTFCVIAIIIGSVSGRPGTFCDRCAVYPSLTITRDCLSVRFPTDMRVGVCRPKLPASTRYPASVTIHPR